MLRYVLSGITRGSTSSLAARTTTAPRRATRFVACEVKTRHMPIGQSIIASSWVGTPAIAIAIAPERARATSRIKNPYASTPRARPRALALARARRPQSTSSTPPPPYPPAPCTRHGATTAAPSAHRATPSRRRARARVKDKKYHHPSIRARAHRARTHRARVTHPSVVITPSATDDVASPRIASHRNHRRRRRPANGDHRHLSHTHIYIRTVAFTRRCTTADRAVSELDIVVVGAREVK